MKTIKSILSSDSVPCIAFDSDLFPNFFTITSCFGQDKRRQQIYNNQNYCYSSDPKTNIASGPVFCKNRLDSFFTATRGVIDIATDYETIVNAIEFLMDSPQGASSFARDISNPYVTNTREILRETPSGQADLFDFDYQQTTTARSDHLSHSGPGGPGGPGGANPFQIAPVTENTSIVPLESVESQREDNRIVNEVDYFYYNESPVDPPIVNDDEGLVLFNVMLASHWFNIQPIRVVLLNETS